MTIGRVNKKAVRQRFGLNDDESGPLVAVVSRLTWQKGMDLLLAELPGLLAQGGQLALLGAGDAALEESSQQPPPAIQGGSAP